MSATVPVEPGKNPPQVTLDVPSKEVGQLRALKAGDRVRITLTAEVVEKTEKEPEMGYPVGFAGSLRIEVLRMLISRDNAFSDLADEDD